MRNISIQREQFIDATIHKVAELGLENLRTKHIAADVDMSEASMFLYFGNKEGILREAFFEVDRRLSNLLLKSAHLTYQIADLSALSEVAHHVWQDVFHYLIENRDETLFTIRYRYSAYYTPEVRARRQAHNGAFEQIYQALGAQFNESNHFYEGFLVNYIFELTLSFAEKIINGYLAYTAETEELIWNGIKNVSASLMEIKL